MGVKLTSNNVSSFDDVNRELNVLRDVLKNLGFLYGSGTPEGNVYAKYGWLYRDIQNGYIYIKQSNLDSRTGWYNLFDKLGLLTDDIDTINSNIVYTTGFKDLSLTLSGWTNTFAKGYFYKLTDGTWGLNFKLKGTMTASARTSLALQINGCDFGTPASSYSQSVNGGTTTVAPDYVVASENSIIWHYPNTSTSLHWASGDVWLHSKPTGYDIPDDI